MSICLLLSLGFWQLNRGLEKDRIARSMNNTESIILLDQEIDDDLQKYQFRMAQVSGTLQTMTPILLANRFFESQVGYELFLVLSTTTGKALLINAGWLKNPDEVADVVSRVGQLTTIKGVAYSPTKGFTIGDSYVGGVQWPLVVQYLDFESLSVALGVDLLPVVVVTNFENAGLKKIWDPYIVTAERHYGYAVQWWGLALVLIIFSFVWLRVGLRNKINKED